MTFKSLKYILLLFPVINTVWFLRQSWNCSDDSETGTADDKSSKDHAWPLFV